MSKKARSAQAQKKKGKYLSIYGLNKIPPPEGQQQGGRATPKREELHEGGGAQGEGGVPIDADLKEQADNGQTEALGGLVASVKQLQVSGLMLLAS